MNEAIQKDMQAAYGLRINDIQSVSGGWLNEKWRVKTDAGELLVKRYSYERYNSEKTGKNRACASAAGMRA